VNFGKSIFFPMTAALRPPLACEIAPAGVVAARLDATSGYDGQALSSAFAPLPAGLLFTGLKAPGLSDRAGVASALRQALHEVAQRDTKVTVVIPDTAVRVLLLDFDNLPSKQEEILPIIRFRLRKLVPFEVEDAAVSYQTMSGKDGMVRIICAISPAAVIGEYEGAVRDAGYEPGSVLPSTLAALAGLSGGPPSLVVNCNRYSITTAIVSENDLLLYRTLELAEPDSSHTYESDPTRTGEELRQSVSVAVAYFEDTLLEAPKQLFASGPGGAEELVRMLGDPGVPVRDLGQPTTTGNLTAMPPGLLAGVRGALAS
jgi:type IV pilus assembly protein PilM